MPKQYCFLCASDEGVFLDITPDNKQIFYEQFEICSFVQIPTADQLPIKICHKCAYEVNQCSSFVQKYKRATKLKGAIRKNCCSVCREPAKNEFIFDLRTDKDLEISLLKKIQKLFNNEQNGKSCEDYKVICLSCRYTVDMLLDLKNVCKEVAVQLNSVTNEEIDYLTFPKIKTTVVNRKTTITESAHITLNTSQEAEESEDQVDEMTRTRSQEKLNNNKLVRKSKSRTCIKCNNPITVSKMQRMKSNMCKTCQNSMDTQKIKSEKTAQQNITETKHCTVYLKDVLKDVGVKEKKLYKVDKDNKGKKSYIVTVKDSANEKRSTKTSNDVNESAGKQGVKRVARNMKTENENENVADEDAPNIKKYKVDEEQTNEKNSKEVEHEPRRLRQFKRKNISNNINQNPDSDSAISKTNRKRIGKILTKHKLETGASLSDADVDNKRSRKKLRNILSGFPTTKTTDASDESSSNDDALSRKRTKLSKASSAAASLSNSDKIHEHSETSISLRKMRRGQKDTKSAVAQDAQSSESSDAKENIFETRPYICDECGASYENRLLGMTHKLMHYKQPKLKLEKVSQKNVVKEDMNEAMDETEDPSENIKIAVDDDEEETGEEQNKLTATDSTEDSSNTQEDEMQSSKKEVQEDAVDVQLVMKESDDDQTHKPEGEGKESQTEEDLEVSVTDPSSPSESRGKKYKRKKRRSKSIPKGNEKAEKSILRSAEDENANSEEQDVLRDDTDKDERQHMEKDEEQAKDREEGSKSEAEQIKASEVESAIEEKEGMSLTEDIQGSGEVEQDGTEKEENIREDAQSNEEAEEGEKEENVGEETKNIGLEEGGGGVGVTEKVEENKEKDEERDKQEDVKKKSKEEEERTKEEDTGKDNKEGEERKEDIMQVEEQEITCTELGNVSVVCENSISKSSEEVTKESSIIEEELEPCTSSKQDVLNDTRNEKAKDVIEVELEITNNLKEIEEQKSPKSALKGKSLKAAEEEAKESLKNLDFSEKIVLPEESDILGNNDISMNDAEITGLDVSKLAKSMNDSANAAAEVLQEVLDLASAEVQKRQEIIDTTMETDSIEAETLENISREIQNSVDMPPLKMDDAKGDDICVM